MVMLFINSSLKAVCRGTRFSISGPIISPIIVQLVRFNHSNSNSSSNAGNGSSTNEKQQEIIDYYKLFPNTFPNGSAGSPFLIDLKKLRKEYRTLQQENHPDILHGSVQLTSSSPEEQADQTSMIINKAYSTLTSSLKRAQFLLKKNANIDLNDDDSTKDYQFKDKSLLMQILEIHEELENISNEEELNQLKISNDERIANTEKKLDQLFKEKNYEDAALETVKLKYWFNIENAIKNWEPGKAVNLTH